jgi:hypothetical protein
MESGVRAHLQRLCASSQNEVKHAWQGFQGSSFASIPCCSVIRMNTVYQRWQAARSIRQNLAEFTPLCIEVARVMCCPSYLDAKHEEQSALRSVWDRLLEHSLLLSFPRALVRTKSMLESAASNGCSELLGSCTFHRLPNLGGHRVPGQPASGGSSIDGRSRPAFTAITPFQASSFLIAACQRFVEAMVDDTDAVINAKGVEAYTRIAGKILFTASNISSLPEQSVI